jgi:HEAT repeat protein
MTQNKRAGASRPSRRLVLNSAAIVTIGIGLLLTIGRGDAEKERGSYALSDGSFARTDAEIAAHLLASVKGANGVVCAAIDRTFDMGNWGKLQLFMNPDVQASEDDIETAQWIGKRKLDPAALTVARPALSSDDACTRRIGVRLVGNVDSKRLDEELMSELESPVAAVRVAAILALGYAEQATSLPRLRELARAGDRAIRVAAIWALGRIEDESSTDLMVSMLKDDRDPEVRRAAAWALGQIHD